MANNTETKETIKYYYPLMTARERVLIWQRIKGIWKNRKPEPNQELKKIRSEWDRKLPMTDK